MQEIRFLFNTISIFGEIDVLQSIKNRLGGGG